MKTIPGYSYSVIVIISLLQFFSSCSLSIQNDIACPDFKNDKQQTSVSLKQPYFYGFLKNQKSKHANYKKVGFETYKGFESKEMQDEYPPDYLPYRHLDVIAEKFVISKQLSKGTQQFIRKKNLSKNKKPYHFAIKKNVETKKDTLCDTLFLKNGKKIPISDIEIDENTVKFIICGSKTGSDFMLRKNDVLKIKYNNGVEKLITKAGKSEDHIYTGKKEFEIFGIIGFFLAFLMPPVGIILGIVSLIKIHKHPEKYNGQGFAIASIIIGIIVIILTILFIKVSFGLLNVIGSAIASLFTVK